LKRLRTRRLWDVRARECVTFATVRDWLGAGNEVQVTEQDRNLDVTRELLLKVVVDHERGAVRLFSNEVLLALIRIQGAQRRREVRRFLDRLVRAGSDAAIGGSAATPQRELHADLDTPAPGSPPGRGKHKSAGVGS
jgi:polyhydroxyalkanoate synthesis repressor PhaR